MNNKTSINSTQKIFVNISLICLGISANATFFSLMVTFLLGTVVLGWLGSQKDKFTLNTENISKKAEKKAISSGINQHK
ncbi:hypothetical protein [Crocosphaera chwakensis]|uniref:Uncharacterized protein n=1 Tax=Crocosphaera chwakensis CCY0110 TaxID=391612 RepID=A3IVI2_9CHRO|nr:hypothetical protein [Crocosphaera chwakensis]EAZ89554.1 hypothetical protein CY0110_09296 [Crocosphaera chwakensis CCY0110]